MSQAVFDSHFEHWHLNILYSCFLQDSPSQASPKRSPRSHATASGLAEDIPADDRPPKSPSVESSGENCHCLWLILD